MKMERVIKIIKEIKPNCDINESTRLIENNILDSLAIVSLVSEVSDEFDVDIPIREVIPQNFETVKSIRSLIERLEDED